MEFWKESFFSHISEDGEGLEIEDYAELSNIDDQDEE